MVVASAHLSLDLFNFLYGLKNKKKTKEKKNKNCDYGSNLVSKIKSSIPVFIPKIISLYRDCSHVFFLCSVVTDYIRYLKKTHMRSRYIISSVKH